MKQPDDNGEPNMAGASSAASYIAAMADELARLAKRNGLDPLAYILEMARLEADQTSKTMKR